MQVSLASKEKALIEILHRRRMVAVLSGLVAFSSAIAAILLRPPSYVATSQVLLVNEEQGRATDASGDLPAIASSSETIDRVRRKLNLRDSVSEIRKRLSTHVAPRGSLMTISYQDRSPDLAVSVSNGVADVFSAYYGKLSTVRYDAVISRLRGDLAAKKVSVHDFEQKMQRKAAESSYSGSGQSLDDTAKRIGDLQTQRTFAYAQLVSDDAQLTADRSQPRRISGIVHHEILGSSQVYENIKTAVAKDEADLASVRANYTSHYPGLPGLDARVREENAELDRYARLETEKQAATVAGDRARVDALDREMASAHAQLNNLPPSSTSVGELRALRDGAEAQYQALALRLSNAVANSAEASALGAVIVVDRATKAAPSLVGPRTLLIVAMLAAIALAIAAAYVAEAIDPRFISTGDVESIYGQRVLGRLG